MLDAMQHVLDHETLGQPEGAEVSKVSPFNVL